MFFIQNVHLSASGNVNSMPRSGAMAVRCISPLLLFSGVSAISQVIVKPSGVETAAMPDGGAGGAESAKRLVPRTKQASNGHVMKRIMEGSFVGIASNELESIEKTIVKLFGRICQTWCRAASPQFKDQWTLQAFENQLFRLGDSFHASLGWVCLSARFVRLTGSFSWPIIHSLRKRAVEVCKRKLDVLFFCLVRQGE